MSCDKENILKKHDLAYPRRDMYLQCNGHMWVVRKAPNVKLGISMVFD